MYRNRYLEHSEYLGCPHQKLHCTQSHRRWSASWPPLKADLTDNTGWSGGYIPGAVQRPRIIIPSRAPDARDSTRRSPRFEGDMKSSALRLRVLPATGGGGENNLGHDEQKKPWTLMCGNLGSHPEATEWRIPRSNEMIGIDRADELGCLCVPSCNGVCVAAIRRGKSRIATSVIGQFPGNDARLIGVARNYKP